MATKVDKCKCAHDGQDKLHGAGNRVHNETVKKEWRCTVCEAVKGASK